MENGRKPMLFDTFQNYLIDSTKDDQEYDELIVDKATQTDATNKMRQTKACSSVKRWKRNRFGSLNPRSAQQILNELTCINKKYNVFFLNNRLHCKLQINNVCYEGEGPSNFIAKNNAAEKALRDIMVPRINGTAQYAVDINTVDEFTIPPMIQIASFALHKLFEEWNLPTQNITSPVDIHSSLYLGDIHPASLLNMRRPGTTYFDEGSIGDPPNKMFKVSVKVDNERFFGEGRSKKIARKLAAMEALKYI